MDNIKKLRNIFILNQFLLIITLVFLAVFVIVSFSEDTDNLDNSYFEDVIAMKIIEREIVEDTYLNYIKDTDLKNDIIKYNAMTYQLKISATSNAGR